MRFARLRGTVAAVGLAATGVLLASTGCPSLAGFGGGEAGVDAGDDGGDAAFEADAPDAGPTPDGYLSLADAARFCSQVLGCANLAASTQHSIGIPIDSKNYSACVSWLAGQLPPGRIGLPQARSMLRCAVNAGTCAAANACMWWEVIDPADLRCAGVDSGATNACSPSLDAIYYCSSMPPYVWHCTSEVYYPGSTCLFDDGGIASYACEVANGCGSVPASGECMGNVAAICTSGNRLQAYDCSVIGLPCGYDKSIPAYDCLSNGKEVFCPDQTVPPKCAGTVVSLCAGSFQGGIDCGPLGGTCEATGTPRCALPSDTCSPNDATINACTGEVISLCVSGQPAMLDCTTLGLHCVPANGGQTAHCG